MLETKKKPTITEIIDLIISSYEKFFIDLNSYNYGHFKKRANFDGFKLNDKTMNALIGDIGNTTTKICLIEIKTFKVKKIINFNSNNISSKNFLKKKL